MLNNVHPGYYYKMSVYTGMRPNAGTKSRVQFELEGDEGKTDVRFLMDKDRRSVSKINLTIRFSCRDLIFVDSFRL